VPALSPRLRAGESAGGPFLQWRGHVRAAPKTPARPWLLAGNIGGLCTRNICHDMQKLDAGADRTAMRPGHLGRLRGARVAEALGMVKEWSRSRLTSFDSASWSRKTDEARSKD